MRREADEYAFRVLERLRQQVHQVDQSIERGMDELMPETDGAAAPARR
jgi:hypothetical protein